MEGREEEKQTNEIKTAKPLLEPVNIEGKDVSVDALMTQREFAIYIVDERKAHYHFTAKGNQKGLMEDIELFFKDRNLNAPDYMEKPVLAHGRIEQRKIWVTTELNGYLDFPHVGQAFCVERHVIVKKTGKTSIELAHGILSRTTEQASPAQVLKTNRGHWVIESTHYMIDWNFDEDRSLIRTGYGPENVTRMRRFVIGLIKAKDPKSVAQVMRKLNRNLRAVLDIFRMTKNSQPKMPCFLCVTVRTN